MVAQHSAGAPAQALRRPLPQRPGKPAAGPGARWPSGGWQGLTLVLAVTLAHLWLCAQLLADSWGLGAEPNATTARMEVAFVRELQQAAPARTPPAPAQRRAAVVAAAPASAAAAALRTAVKPPAPAQAPELSQPPVAMVPVAEPAPLPPPINPLPLPEPAETAVALSSTPPAPGPTAPVAPSADDGAGSAITAPATLTLPLSSLAAPAAAFEWPPSTRLSYTLTGNYRGPVEGQARVEWLTNGGRYQVHLDASVGPSFAPLVTRRLSSEGVLTAAGLAPRRYEEVTTAPLRAPRRVNLIFGEEQVRLANGSEVPRPPGLQDSASQFVQMTWLFTTQPQLLEAGRSVIIPLALPGRVEPWTYVVRAGEPLNTPVGTVATVHVQPQRGARPGDLTVEFWVAPSLQNLPVRILIRQDADNYIDLKLDRLPQQAGGR